MISVSLFHVFRMNNKIIEKNAPGVVLARFYRPGVLNSFFAQVCGIRPSKKLPGGFAQGGGGGGMVRLGID